MLFFITADCMSFVHSLTCALGT